MQENQDDCHPGFSVFLNNQFVSRETKQHQRAAVGDRPYGVSI